MAHANILGCDLCEDAVEPWGKGAKMRNIEIKIGDVSGMESKEHRALICTKCSAPLDAFIHSIEERGGKNAVARLEERVIAAIRADKI